MATFVLQNNPFGYYNHIVINSSVQQTPRRDKFAFKNSMRKNKQFLKSDIILSSHRTSSIKKLLLKVSEMFQGNTSARFFSNKVSDWRLVTLLKKWIWPRYFLVNFSKFSKNIFFTEHILTTASAYSYIDFQKFDKLMNCLMLFYDVCLTLSKRSLLKLLNRGFRYINVK